MSTKTKGKVVRKKKILESGKKAAVPSYFSPESSAKVGDLLVCSPAPGKMALSPAISLQNLPPSSPAPSRDEDGPICRSDLQLLKQDIHKYFKDAIVEYIKPLKEKVQELTEDLATTAKIAEKTAELGLSIKEELISVKSNEMKLQNRILVLENKWRSLNLKLRGFEEGAEEKSDLLLFIANWLQEKFSFSGNMSNNIVKVQRLGSRKALRNNFTRDILVQFSNSRIKDMILQKARQTDALTYNGKLILFLLDLSPDTLEKRKNLKIITSKLHANNLRFRWSPTSEILLFKDGVLHRAFDAHSGITLMEALALKTSQEEKDALWRLFPAPKNQAPDEIGEDAEA